MTAVDWWLQNHVIKNGGGGHLLEFGAGRSFRVINLVRHRFAHCSATDIEAVPSTYWPPNVTFRRCDASSIPFGDAMFDVVAIRSVIEHLPHPAETFAELSRVMKPGARLFMNLPNKWDYVSVAARLSGAAKSRVLRRVLQPSWDDFPVYYRANTRRALEAALHASDLEIETFAPLPSEPAYLTFFAPAYVLGVVYQFVIGLACVDALQPSFLVGLRKRAL